MERSASLGEGGGDSLAAAEGDEVLASWARVDPHGTCHDVTCRASAALTHRVGESESARGHGPAQEGATGGSYREEGELLPL